MLSVDGLTVEFGGTTLFKDVSFVINPKDRIALMGKNGAGKSTLLKILAGVRQPTSGRVSAPKDCTVCYLPQHMMTEDVRTVFDEASQAFAHLREMEAEIDAMNNELATRTDYESDSYMALIDKVAAASEKFYAIDMSHFEEDVEKALLGLGFKREDFNRPTSEFSGGWRMRIELAKLLLQNPDVLLLDEPTNHLDIESIGWLEDFIVNSPMAVVVISHDRRFIDNITTRTIEVTLGRIYDYKARYSHYLELRKERRQQQQKQYDDQLLEPINLLILDEPTNHLDLKTKDILKQALRDFDGTLIVVSHDRDFLDGLVEKVYEFGDGRVREHLCGINEFLEKKKSEQQS